MPGSLFISQGIPPATTQSELYLGRVGWVRMGGQTPVLRSPIRCRDTSAEQRAPLGLVGLSRVRPSAARRGMDDATDEDAHEERDGNEQKVDSAVDPRRERWVIRDPGGDRVDENAPDNASDRAQLLPSQCQHRTREHAEHHLNKRHDNLELDVIADSPLHRRSSQISTRTTATKAARAQRRQPPEDRSPPVAL